MFILLLSLTLLLMLALAMLALPFLKTKHSLLSKPFVLISASIVLTSMTLYLSFGDSKALLQWLAYGKQHYELAVQVEELGGIDGIIARLKKKLENRPNDQKGQEILHKLLAAKKNTK